MKIRLIVEAHEKEKDKLGPIKIVMVTRPLDDFGHMELVHLRQSLINAVFNIRTVIGNRGVAFRLEE